MMKTKEKNGTYSEAVSDGRSQERWVRLRLIGAAAAVLCLLFYYFYSKSTQWLWVLGALLFSGWYTAFDAVQALVLHRKATRPLLFALVGLGAFLLGYRCQGAVLMLLYIPGDILGKAAAKKVERTIRSLGDLRPERTRLVRENAEEFADPADIEPGDVLCALTDEKIAVDGVALTAGQIAPSVLSGEAGTRKISAGAVVHSGALNLGGRFYYQATKKAADSAVETVIARAEQAAARKAGNVVLAEKIGTIYTRILYAAAILWLPIGCLWLGRGFGESAYISLLLCLIGEIGTLSESLSLCYFAGVAALAVRGVLVKSAAVLAGLRKMRGVIFDKTGVLTESEYTVREIVPHNNVDKATLLRYAATAEQISRHSIARAILKTAGEKKLPPAEHQQKIDGEGVCVFAKGKRIFVGNEHLMRRAGIRALPYHGTGVVCFVGVDEAYLGCIILTDPLRNTAAKTVDGLFKGGVQFIDLVSGDNEENTQAVAAQLGLHRVFFDLDAQRKRQMVEKIMRHNRFGGKTAFVGNAAQDETCLAAADISFAVDKSGVQAEKHHVLLLSGDPFGVLQSFLMSQKIHHAVCANTYLSVAMKVLMLALLFAGAGHLWLFAAIRAVWSVFCMINAGRCLHVEE